MCTLEKTEYEYAEDKYTLKRTLYEASLIRLKVLLNSSNSIDLISSKANVTRALEEVNNAFKTMEVERYKACRHVWFIDQDDRCLCTRCGADSNVLKDQNKLTEIDLEKDAECEFFYGIDLDNLPGIEIFVNGDLCKLQELFIKISNANPDATDEELASKFESALALRKSLKASEK